MRTSRPSAVRRSVATWARSPPMLSLATLLETLRGYMGASPTHAGPTRLAPGPISTPPAGCMLLHLTLAGGRRECGGHQSRGPLSPLLLMQLAGGRRVSCSCRRAEGLMVSSALTLRGSPHSSESGAGLATAVWYVDACWPCARPGLDPGPSLSSNASSASLSLTAPSSLSFFSFS